MTAADAIAAFGPAKHWRFDDAVSIAYPHDPTVVSGDIPNEYESGTVSLPDMRHFGVDVTTELEGLPFNPGYERPYPEDVVASCAGGKLAYARWFYGATDFRAPRGAYKPDELGEFGVSETPEDIPRSPLPFPLFSGPFTLLYMGGNLTGRRMQQGVGGFTPATAESSWAPVLWYGSAVACVGFESGANGSWFGMGAQDGIGATVHIGNGVNTGQPYPGPARVAVGGAAGLSGWGLNGKGIYAFAWNPSRPAGERAMVWADGSFNYVAEYGDLSGVASLLGAYSDPHLFFATGWSPDGMLRTVLDEEGDPVLDGEGNPVVERIYPWNFSYGGVLSNVALFDRAMSFGELRDLFATVNGTPPNGCSEWVGGGIVAIINVTPLGDNRYRFDATDSYHSQGGTIVSYEWLAGSNYIGEFEDEGAGIITSGDIVEFEVPYPDVFGNAVEIVLRATDNFGAQGFMTVTVHPAPPSADEDPGIATGRGRMT